MPAPSQLSARFDHYPRFEELSAWLQEFADQFPDLVELSTIGESYEQRPLWLLTVTNRATGPADEKPALWLDGNIHASEVTASVALVHLVQHLCTGYGIDDKVTRALDTRTFYIVPRVNPDGAELALAEVPRIVRSTTRPWPLTEQLDGLIAGDIDHDGRQLQMRVEDPNGPWKPFGADPRLLVARDPDEEGPGPYYRVLAEGRIQNYDGLTVRTARQLAGIDSNRNFPNDWARKVENAPTGAGDFPTSEPEVAALVRAVTDRPNITGYFAYHTYSGVHLRAFGNKADDALTADDLWTYQELGKRATEITGYPSISVYHDFRYHPKSVITGTGSDWAFDHVGVYAWTTEFWSPLRAAGIDDPHPIEWYRNHPVDDELKLLAWVDEHVPDGYVDWYHYEHPELGPVELGGWHVARVFRNPPPEMLEAEIAPHSELAVFHALCSPLLRHRETLVEAVGDGAWRVRVVVENAGWMTTNVTKQALDRGVVQPLVARITLPEGAELASGTARLELGQLTGRALKSSAIHQFGSSDETTDRAVAEWFVRAPAGTVVDVEARHDRAGVVTTSVTLE
jgi:hypothetical protein